MRRERLYLEDIVTAADAIAEFTYAQNPESFEANLMLRSAVVHQLTVIGEAVAHLSEGLRGHHPEIPWTDIKGFRNIIVHNYFGIDWGRGLAFRNGQGSRPARPGRRYPPHRGCTVIKRLPLPRR
jgi:uncharacterized protein with HEPN domain